MKYPQTLLRGLIYGSSILLDTAVGVMDNDNMVFTITEETNVNQTAIQELLENSL